MTEIKGIDVSAWNGSIDWKTVAEYGMGFAILRITEKGNKIDSTFETNYKGCINNDIPIGVYKYSYATTISQIKEEANTVIKVLNKRKLNLPVFLDIEDKCQENLSSTLMMQMINAFRSIIINAGYMFGIYCGDYWYKTKLPNEAKKYDCWLAAYPNNDDGTLQERLRPSDGIGWQYSSKATIPGIPTKVDRNVFYKDYKKISNTHEIEKPVSDLKITIDQAIDALITCAKNEINYLEKRSNSQLDDKTANAGSANYTKYWRDLKPSYQGQPWCAVFVSWCMVQAFGLETAKKLLKHESDFPYVYCPTLGARFTKYANPQKGDIVIFYRSGEFAHTGIVIKVDGDKFWTIEGNTSGGSDIIPNGGGVCEKSYYNSQLPGTKFCRPDYSIITSINTSSSSTTTIGKNYISYGDTGSDVKALQTNLNKLGFKGADNKSLVVDGSFGDNCLFAVKSFQKKNNLTVDGIVGQITQTAITKALAALNSTTYTKWVGQCSKTTTTVYKSATSTTTLTSYPKLAKGNLVDVIGESNYRYKVCIAGKYIGYVLKADIIKSTTSDSKYPFVGRVTASKLNVRVNPNGAIYDPYPMLANGNLVDILSEEDGWYKVRIAGTHIAYVSSKYIVKN